MRQVAHLPLLAALVTSCVAGDGASSDAPLPEWTLRETLRIGARDESDQNLTRVLGVLPVPNGYVWVMQSDDNQFRVYSPEGRLVQTVGEEGQGPGQLILPSGVGWWKGARDTVWVYEVGNRRVSLFTLDGAFARSFSTRGASYLDGWAINRPEIILSDGTALGVAQTRPPAELTDFRIVRYDPEDGTAIGEVARMQRGIGVPISASSRTTVRLPVPDNELIAFAPDGRWFVVVDRHAVGMPELDSVPVYAIGLAGDTLWTRALPYEPLPLLQSEIDSVQSRAKLLGDMVGRAGGTPAEAQDRMSRMVLPGHRPAVERVVIGSDNRVWIEWATTPPNVGSWLALSHEGEAIATIAPGKRVDLLAADATAFWAVELDELDVPYVVRYTIAQGGE
jgi:hypothetical protein